ncbi:MAG TPA: NUDIX hydrolase, partial [Candidatus Paceibacterota bacterium]
MTDYDLPPDENYGMPEFDMPEEHVKWFTDRGWKHEERPDYTMYSKMSPTGIRHSVYWDGRRAWDRNEPVYQLESTIPSKQDSSGTRTVQSEPNAIFESSDPQAIADKARQNEQAWMTGEHNSVRNPGLLKFMEDPGHQEYDKRFWDEPVEEFPAGKIGDKEFVEPKEKLHPYWRGGPEGRSGLGKLNAAQTPGQRGAEEFLNSPDYWNLVNQGTHPEHRDTEAEFPYYEEDYDVYPGHDEAGPSHDLRAHDRSEHDYEDEPRHEEPEPEYVEGPQNDYERELHQQLGQAGFTYRRDGEYGKTDEHGNWHTVMMPGDYRRARSLTTEFYNPRTEQTITHSGHNNHDSVLDRLDINHEYSKAQAANPNADYKTHFLNWVRRNPESYTAQEYRRMSRWGYVDPVKSHFPWAELQGLSPEQSAFQRTHPKVRRQILDGLRGNIDYKTWQNLVQIHNIQARVDRLRSQQGRPSPYRHPNAPQPVHNPRDITMELPRVAAAAIPDESTLKAAGIAVIAMDTGRVLMQQRALNPIMCPCGMGVTWDEMNGYQHDDGSVSHDGEFYGQSVSDLLDQGHPMESDNEEEDLEDDDGIDKTAALEFDPNEGTWEFPGGKLDEGESARAAAIREFREEVGQEIPPGVFVGAWVSPGGIVVAASTTKVAVQPGDPSYGFQGSGHTAPTRGEEGNKNTLDNMDDIMPDYLEHPEYFGSGYRGDLAEMEAHSKARRARGNPDKKVWIYRAVPHGISKIYGNTELAHMFPDKDPTDLAEWVTTSKTYAQQHANSESCPKCKGKMQIVAARARAGDLVNEGYPTEFGYVGDATLEHVGANRIYKTKCPAPRKTEEQRNQEYLDSLDENDHPTAETYKIIRGSSVHQASDWEQFDKNPDYRWGHTDGARGDQQRYDELSAKLDMGMGLEPAEADYLEGHIHGTEGARENARATHNIMKLWRDAPDYPQKEAAAKGPVYKGFIYLIQKESDIDLGNREIANPDDPDGDMSEQSAWWEIDHAKKNPALRKEVKSSTPWDELELWADRSVRANKEIKKAFNILAAAQTPAQLAAQKWLDENPGEFTYWNGSPDSSTGRFDIGSGEPPPDVDYEESRRRSNALAEQHGFRYIEPSNATMRGFFYRDSPTKPGMGQRLTEPSGWAPYWQVHQGPARNYGHSDYSVGMHQNLEDALANADYQDSRVAHEAASLEPEDIRTYNPEDRIKGITTEDRVRPGDPAAGESWWEHVPVKREAAVDRPDERPKLPEGLVYHDISEQPWQHFKDDGEETKFWRWRDRYLVPPLDEANPQHYQLGQGDTHHRSVDWQPMIMEKPQTDYTDEEHFDRAYSGPKTSVKWDEPICEDCYLRYGSTVPAGSHAFAMQRYWDDLGEKKHEFKPMMPDV